MCFVVAGCQGRDKVPTPGAFRPPERDQDAGIDAASPSGFAGSYSGVAGSMSMPSAGASGGMAAPDAWTDGLADDEPPAVAPYGLGALEDIFINDRTHYAYMHPKGLLVGNSTMIYLALRVGAHKSWTPPTDESVQGVTLRGNRIAAALVHKYTGTIRVISLDITQDLRQGSAFTVSDVPENAAFGGSVVQLSDDRVVLCVGGFYKKYVTYKLDSGERLGASEDRSTCGDIKGLPDRDAFIETRYGTDDVFYFYFSVPANNVPVQMGGFVSPLGSHYAFAGAPTTQLFTNAGQVLDVSESACEGASASDDACLIETDSYRAGELSLVGSGTNGEVFAMLKRTATTMCTALRLNVVDKSTVSMALNECAHERDARWLINDPWSERLLYVMNVEQKASIWLKYK